MDRGYVDFRRLHRFTICSAFFVTRAKRGLDYTRRSRRRVDKSTGLRSDQTIVLAGSKTSRLYPDPLRRISSYDAENDRRFVFLTNSFTLPALTVAKIYKCRWQVGLFFKWIRRNLHIKSFYGASANAVKIQVWIAISVCVLVAIVKKELGLERSLGEILQILSLTLFEKTPIFQTLSEQKPRDPEPPLSNQLSLFDL
jgi:Transposase DDE domain